MKKKKIIREIRLHKSAKKTSSGIAVITLCDAYLNDNNSSIEIMS